MIPKPDDMYTRLAKKYCLDRTSVKNICFAIAYGAGISKTAAMYEEAVAQHAGSQRLLRMSRVVEHAVDIIQLIIDGHILTCEDVDNQISDRFGAESDHHRMAVFNLVMNDPASDQLFVDVSKS